MSLRHFIVTLVLCTTLAIAAFAGRASASDGAFVVNHGNNPGDTCSITAFGGFYVGSLTMVTAPSGNLHLGCTTMLVSGASVSNTMIVNSGGEMLVVNPGGVAILSF
jgi:hypothetical protein